MSPAFRKIHRVASPWIFFLLFITLVSGVTYRLGRAWFGMPRSLGDRILAIHAGEWAGEVFSPFYVMLVGGGLLLLLATGAILLWKSRAKAGARRMHRILGAILLLPLTITAVTGILFKLGDDWLHFSDGTKDLLMMLHEGAWLGRPLKPFYVLFLGAGLLMLGFYGLKLNPFRRRKP